MVKKYKYFIIALFIFIAGFLTGFFAGRRYFIERAKQDSSGLEQSIDDAIGTGNSISDGINSATDVVGGINNRNDDIIAGVHDAIEYTQSAGNLANECLTIIDNCNRDLEERANSIRGDLEYTIYLLEYAQLKSEENERIIVQLTDLLNKYAESTGKQ